MDRAAERIAQDIRNIVNTRVAIAEKLGVIQHHVGGTMKHAKDVIGEMADKTSSSARTATEVTANVLDPVVQLGRHPWALIGGALVVGFAVGTMQRRGWKLSDGVVPYYPPKAKGAPIMPAKGSSSSQTEESGVYRFYPQHRVSNPDRPTIWAELEETVRGELDAARSGLIGIVRGMVREFVRRAVPVVVQKIDGSGRS